MSMCVSVVFIRLKLHKQIIRQSDFMSINSKGAGTIE